MGSSLSEESPAELVRRFWERVEARDWDGAGALLAEDFVAEWPHSLERFRGRDPYISMNRAYPEGWRIEVQRVVADGDVVACEVRVPLGEQVSHLAAFYEVRDGLIRRVTEYWVDRGQQPPPEWRLTFSEPMSPSSPRLAERPVARGADRGRGPGDQTGGVRRVARPATIEGIATLSELRPFCL